VPGSGGGPVTTFAVPKAPTTAPTAPTTAATTAGTPAGGQNQVSPPTASPPGLFSPGGGSGGGGLLPGRRVGQQGSSGGQNLGFGP
jgi:hypothetical protein